MSLKQVNVTELDFDKIKSEIKEYYKRSDSPFKDFDFEGSGLNIILDILAYNTHYNAVLAHLAANESFIASAQLRKNVVARAKTLGYIPHSRTAARATVTLTNLDSSILSIPAGTTFTSTDSLNGITYSFIPTVEVTETDLPFIVYQGSLKTRKYVYAGGLDNERFELPDTDIDISQITVTVKPNINSTQQETYARFTELSELDGNSAVYFITENPNGKYEIAFGDNIIGKRPAAASLIEITYLVTDGADANGLSAFTTSDALFDSVTIPTITPSSAASGGGNREAIESIRANAPLNYIAQNRAVTIDDYVSLVKSNLNAAAVSVWGGEDNDPPEFGKVFISIKPQTGLTITTTDEATILPILNKKGIVTVRPKLVNPDYTYLYFDIFAKFNSALTNLGVSSINSLIRTNLANFNSANLSDFEGVFRYSSFLSYIVNLDPAILSAFARVKAFKTFTATTTGTSNHNLNFNFPFENPDDPTKTIITSSGFNIGGIINYFADEPSTENNIRNIYRYRVDSTNSLNIMTQRNVGKVDYSTGKITINDFDLDADTEITIFTTPASNDIAPSRNQILEIDSSDHTKIESSVDSIATSGSAGAIGYTTTPRGTSGGTSSY